MPQSKTKGLVVSKKSSVPRKIDNFLNTFESEKISSICRFETILIYDENVFVSFDFRSVFLDISVCQVDIRTHILGTYMLEYLFLALPQRKEGRKKSISGVNQQTKQAYRTS